MENLESLKNLPVIDGYDVVIAGGGTAGMMAAIASARQKAKTLVLERLDCMGGNVTAGMMSLTWCFNDEKKLIVRGIAEEFFNRVEEKGGTIPCDRLSEAFIIYDCEVAKQVCNEMILEESEYLDVLYYTWVADVIMDGNKVCGLIIENKSGRQAVLAKCFIDSTGDADVAYFAGAKFLPVNPDDLHPITLIAKFGGVDLEKMKAYYKERPEYVGNFTEGWHYSPFHTFRIEKELQDVQLPERLEYLRDIFIIYHETMRPNELMVNMTGDIHVDGTDAFHISRAETEARRKLADCLEVFQKYMPGCENAYMIATASTLGIRESRMIEGDYVITLEDLMQCRIYEDTIGCCKTMIGSHAASGKHCTFINPKPGTHFTIPYKALLPVGIDNLLVAGRCISAEQKAMGATRPMPGCFAEGQAVGIAAAMCAARGITPRELPYEDLRAELLKNKAYLP